MVKKVVYTDGGNVITESIDTRQADQVYIDLIVGRGFADAVVIDSSTFPDDREYTQAWELSGSTVSVNMTTAKTIHRDILRNERETHFAETDKLFAEARSQRKDTSAIETRQQYLRDITEDAAIDSATTTTNLKAVTIASWSPPDIKTTSICDYMRTEVDATTYTLTGTDYAVGVIHTGTAAVTLTLPEISSIGHKRYVIKDEGGNAGTNNITINVTGSDTIDGASSQTINTNYGVIALYNNNATGWFIASND